MSILFLQNNKFFVLVMIFCSFSKKGAYQKEKLCLTTSYSVQNTICIFYLYLKVSIEQLIFSNLKNFKKKMEVVILGSNRA